MLPGSGPVGLKIRTIWFNFSNHVNIHYFHHSWQFEHIWYNEFEQSQLWTGDQDFLLNYAIQLSICMTKNEIMVKTVSQQKLDIYVLKML